MTIITKDLPNQLTASRIVLAAVFFVLVGVYEQPGGAGQWLLNTAFVIYIVAGITDVLDGYFARKMNVTSAFGRITDPVVDKILVVGAFAMLAGSNFSVAAGSVEAQQLDRLLPGWLHGGMYSCVQAWMVVVVLAREFIVSALRGYSESQGQEFPATYAGKLKMFLQSIAICVVLYQMANVREPDWAVYVKVTVVWLAVAATVLSGLVYVSKARGLLRWAAEGGERKDAAGE